MMTVTQRAVQLTGDPRIQRCNNRAGHPLLGGLIQQARLNDLLGLLPRDMATNLG